MVEARFALEATFAAEGGAAFTDHEGDHGGPTRWGITEALARAHGYDRPIAYMTKAEAVRIATDEFWSPLRLSEVDSNYIAAEIFDTAFHAGPGAATEIWQEAVSFLGEPLIVDGYVGPKTLAATNDLLPRYEKHLYAALNLFQGIRYVEILGDDDEQRRLWARGWMLRLSRFPEMVAT